MALAVALPLYFLVLKTSSSQSVLTVTSTNDVNDGLCSPYPSHCSLREAINAANASPGPDTIDFYPGVTGTMGLSSSLPSIAREVSITGPGATLLSVDAGQAVGWPSQTGWIFDIKPGVTALISGLTVTGASDSAINNSGKLTLIGVVVSGNTTPNSGGGIWSGINGSLTVIDSSILNNTANAGGGIHAVRTGTLSISGTTISGNSASSFGGALFFGGNNAASMSTYGKITNSTISGNLTGSNSAVVFAAAQTKIDIINSTIAGNSVTGLRVVTVGSVRIQNTILDSNSGGNCSGPNGITSLGHNISSDATCPFSAAGDKQNASAMLGPLQNNSGPTETRALLIGSAAIDGGDNSSCPTTDQRGAPRPSGPSCDIGAYESAAGSSPTPIVGGTGIVAGKATATPSNTPRPIVVETAGVDGKATATTTLTPTPRPTTMPTFTPTPTATETPAMTPRPTSTPALTLTPTPTATSARPVCDLTITKSSDAGSPPPNLGLITYTIRVDWVCPPGVTTTTGVSVHVDDALPLEPPTANQQPYSYTPGGAPQVTFTSATSGLIGCQGPSHVHGGAPGFDTNRFGCDIGILPANGYVIITLQLDTGNNQNLTNTAVVDTDNQVTESNEGNNQSQKPDNNCCP